jgi:hypothetical protein
MGMTKAVGVGMGEKLTKGMEENIKDFERKT